MTTGEVRTVRNGYGWSVARSIGHFLLPENNAAGTIYGTLTVGVLLAAESSQHASAWRDIAAVMGALLVYWLAHGYAHSLGHRLSNPGDSDGHGVLHELREQWTIMRGASVPLVIFIVVVALGFSEHVAVIDALITSIVLLIMFEGIAAFREHAGKMELTTQLIVCLLMCAGILGIKFVL